MYLCMIFLICDDWITLHIAYTCICSAVVSNYRANIVFKSPIYVRIRARALSTWD